MWPSQKSCESASVVLIVPSSPLSKQGTVNKAAKYKPHHKVFLSMSNTSETMRHHTHVESHCALSSARHNMFTPTRVWIHRISNQNQTADLPFLQPQAGCHWDFCTQLQHPFKMHLQLIPFLTWPKYSTSITFQSHNEDIEKVNVVDISSLRLCDRWTAEEHLSHPWRK